MHEIRLDGRYMPTRSAAHDLLAQALALPDYYGRNLDALYDCLTDIGQSTHVTLTHASDLQQSLDAYGALIIRVLLEASEENENLHVTVEA